MRKQTMKTKKTKLKSSHPTIQWAWPVGTAIVGIAVVLSCLVMQMQQRLETVQSEVHSLERSAAGLKEELNKSIFRRNGLKGQLDKANSNIERMQGELEGAKQSARQARAEIATSNKQVAGLSAKLDEVSNKRHALKTELHLVHLEANELRSVLNSAQSKLFEMESSLKGKQNSLEDLEGEREYGKIRKGAGDAGSETEKLGNSWLKTISPLTEQHHTLGRGAVGRDYLIRTLVFEASGETEIGKAAVAHVILNRKRSGRWGHKIRDVVTYPWQFEPWMTRKEEIKKLSQTDPRYLNAAEIVDSVLAGRIPDPTAGATHFLNPVIVRKRRGGSLPLWADGDGQPIGRHVFYCPECDGPVPKRAAA